MEDNKNMLIIRADTPQEPQLIQFPTPYGKEFEGKTLWEYWNVLLKRKYVVLGFLFLTVALTFVIVSLQTSVYRSSVTLQITQENPSPAIERDLASILVRQDTEGKFYETQYILLNSRPLVYNLIKRLSLQDHPEYKDLREGKSKTAETFETLLANRVQNSLEVTPLKKTFLVRVSFYAHDKNLAMQVPSVISNEYARILMETRYRSYDLVKKWLESELQNLAQKVETSERKLYEHGKKDEFLSLEDKDNVVVAKYVELNMLLTKAEAERKAKEALYREVNEKRQDLPAITNNPLIQKIRDDTISQEAKVASLKKVYGENFPQLQMERGKLQELRAGLKNEIQRLKETIKSDYETAARTESLLREAMEGQKQKVGSLQDNLIQHHIIKRDLQTNEGLYQALLARMKDASVASNMVASNVSVIQPPEMPLSPVSPKKKLSLTLASLLGLIGGVGLAFLIEFLDDTIKNTEEMEREAKVPALGLVPFFSGESSMESSPRSEKGSNMLVVLNEPGSIVGEAIRHCRTSIMLSSALGPPRTMMVSSPNPAEGKSTIALVLCWALAIEGRKTILVDCDLRKPQVHRFFAEPQQPGLTNYLTGSASLREIIRDTKIPNLSYIAAGPIPPHPTELLTSQPFNDLMAELREEYQHLMLDTPPIIGFADGRVLSALADGVLLVIKHHSTSRVSARLTNQLLQQVNARVLGCILNMAKRKKLGYGGYYGYYRYYSSYYKGYGYGKKGYRY